MVEIAGLQPHHPRVTSITRADTPSGPRPSISRPSPYFHRARPSHNVGAHDQRIIDLVEIPLVEEEAVKRLVALGEAGRNRRIADVEQPGESKAGNQHDEAARR